VARVIPRALMMFAVAGVLLPLVGLSDWRLRLPSSADAAALFTVAMLLVVLLASAMVMLINVGVVVTLTDRGANALAVGLVVALSGNIVPLPFFPNWMHWFLFLQPFAGLVDIPYRIYFGNLTGAMAFGGLLQMIAWISILVFAGRRVMSRAMA